MNNQFSSEAEQPDLDAQLVAYLDGELDVDESRRIEEALATDPKVRNLLQQLERSWELMDRLPRAEVDENFARTTVEMIAVQAEEDLEREQKQLPRRRRRAWLVGAGGLLAVAAAGFVLVTIFSPRQNDELLMDLPIIENLEQYRQTEDIEFLRLLEKQGVFDQEAQHAP
jgi:anti-sigma factor RsiW